MDRAEKVVLGLAIGDSLGATSEFQIPWEVGKLMKQYPGWPHKLVGGGKARWRKGQPTDDTDLAIIILGSLTANNGVFDPTHISKGFVKWKYEGPSDIGMSTALTLGFLQKNPAARFDQGAKNFYLSNKGAAANGSLMRNAVIPAVLSMRNIDLNFLIDCTVKSPMANIFFRCLRVLWHKIWYVLTKYNLGFPKHHHTLWPFARISLPVLTCVIQSILIWNALKSKESLKPPTLLDIKNLISGPWQNWKQQTQNVECVSWLKKTSTHLLKLEKKLIEELTDFEKYDPWHQDYRGRSGYAVLTLRLALWGLYWSFQDGHPSCIPDWLPASLFEEHKFSVLKWIVSIGADADTYGATAGGLLGAYWPDDIPEDLLDGLEVAKITHQNLNKLWTCYNKQGFI